MRTRTGDKRKDSVRIMRRKMLDDVMEKGREEEENEIETCFTVKTGNV